jgi:hypothetical protein
MKTSNKEHQNNNRQNKQTLNEQMELIAMKMWASSECLGPDEVEQASKETVKYFETEVPYE